MRKIIILPAIIILLGACVPQTDTFESLPTGSSDNIVPLSITAESVSPDMDFAYISLQPGGNHWMAGFGDVVRVDPMVVDLSSTPAWIAGTPVDGGLRWFVVMVDGRVEVIEVSAENEITRSALSRRLPPGQPPLVDLASGSLVNGSNLQASAILTHPILTDQGRLVWITQEGEVVLSGPSGEEMDRVAIQALPDARLVSNGDLVALYAQATDYYDHGILGDGLEGGQLVVLETSNDQLILAEQISPPSGFVYEGLSPMLVDWDQDGQVEILATISDYPTGARFVVYGLDGELLAQSEPIGQGYRWRHQIAVVAFEVGGERMLVSILRPHLDGVVQLHAWRGNELQEITSLNGYSSHRIGERNLDQAAVADFDGDGAVELLLGDLQMGSLALIGWDGARLVEEWRFSLDGIMVTNLGIIETPGGRLAIAVGTDDGKLFVWGLEP